MKDFFVFCFMMWGFFGLVGAVGAGLYLPILSAIYAAIMWLAGCVLFGFAVLMMEATKGVQYDDVGSDAAYYPPPPPPREPDFGR